MPSTNEVSAAMYGDNHPIYSGVMQAPPRPPAGGTPVAAEKKS